MSIRATALNFAVIISVVGAVVVVGKLGHSIVQRSRARAAERPVRVSTWHELTSAGRQTGSKTPKVLLVEFSDFECPFCAKLALTVLPNLQAKYGEDLAVLHRHWPLPTHRNAYDAARAVECAAEQGAYEQYALALFKQQDSIGRKPYLRFAEEVGIADVSRFETCALKTTPVAAIERDVAEVRKLNSPGTPTLILEGWKFDGLRPEQLDSAIEAEIARKRRF